MDGSTEKRRKIVCICKLVSAYPPDKLPHMPPKAIENHDIDWRSPANVALIKVILRYQVVSLNGLRRGMKKSMRGTKNEVDP